MIGSEKPLSVLDESVPMYAQVTTQRALNKYSFAIEILPLVISLNAVSRIVSLQLLPFLQNFLDVMLFYVAFFLR